MLPDAARFTGEDGREFIDKEFKEFKSKDGDFGLLASDLARLRTGVWG